MLLCRSVSLAHNDRGYGLGRAAGEFPVAMATKEMRAQRLQKAHQPPKAHRRVLCACSMLRLVCFQFTLKYCCLLKSFRFFLSQLAQLSKGNMFYKSLIIILVGVPCPLRGITLVVSVTRISVCLKSSIQRGSSKVYSEFSIKNDTPNM